MPAVKTASVPALSRGLAVLELVAGSRSGLTFSQLARSLDAPKSSVHCLLVTFERRGYLHKSEATGRYTCGLNLTRIANVALQTMLLRDKAGPFLRELAEQTALTVHLAVLERKEIMLVAKVTQAGPPVSTWVGKRVDAHCTSLGKCLTAHLPDAEVDEIVRKHGLLRHNENTIRSVRELKQELQKTRERGYATDDEEEEIGMRCAGAPIFDGSGQAVAAVSVSGTKEQIEPDRMPALIMALQQTSAAVSRMLGWSTEVV
jgi:DNA-binding IclR family transcriptional regulator